MKEYTNAWEFASAALCSMEDRLMSGSEGKAGRSFPESLCHRCAAPPRYVTSDRGSTFIYCPVLQRYPPQPVQVCEAFVEKPSDSTPGSDQEDRDASDR